MVLDCQGRGDITLALADDGVGLAGAEPSRGGLGLKMMAHRARVAGGAFRLEEAEGGGTRAVCTVPCAEARYSRASGTTAPSPRAPSTSTSSGSSSR